MNKISIDELELKGKRVFIRVDFNVPLDEVMRVTDETRIVASLPTIRYAMDQGAGVILASHFGRPGGKVDPRYSLRPVAEALTRLLKKEVILAEDCVGRKVEVLIESMKGGDVILLENLRFHKEEEENEVLFSYELSRLADVYVNDAFGTAHRAHASTHGITKHGKVAAAGFLMKKEIEYLGKAISDPRRPFIAILGGAKVSDKIGIINHLLDKVTSLLIGGGMAYTFLKVQGIDVGKSLVEEEKLDVARQILENAQDRRIRLLLPIDHVIAERLDPHAKTKLVRNGQEFGDWLGLDIGPETVKFFSGEIRRARTIIWNGPMGVFEMEPFSHGTVEICKAVSESEALTIIGGGDTAAAVNQAGLAEAMSHISTGGGASLEFLEGKELPGVAALTDKS
ncbi:MAG: phosphoglycerate kinase [Candidatus Tectomicrobia bacterium]|nr:phosphoglycerate kinase [Candidatus Tectomicrobia bacterium]